MLNFTHKNTKYKLKQLWNIFYSIRLAKVRLCYGEIVKRWTVPDICFYICPTPHINKKIPPENPKPTLFKNSVQLHNHNSQILFVSMAAAAAAAAAAAKSLQSCPTLCDPIDGSATGSSIPGILQARTLEWVAISSSNAWNWKVKVKLLSRVWLFVTSWTAAHQAPPSMGFSRQEYTAELLKTHSGKGPHI